MNSGGPILWEDPVMQKLVLTSIIVGSMPGYCATKFPAIVIRTGTFIDWIVFITRGKNWQTGE